MKTENDWVSMLEAYEKNQISAQIKGGSYLQLHFHKVSFWASNYTDQHSVNFWSQKALKWVNIISDNMGQFLRPGIDTLANTFFQNSGQ
jgi:hypothetical protein